jgi:hypothetical protein
MNQIKQYRRAENKKGRRHRRPTNLTNGGIERAKSRYGVGMVAATSLEYALSTPLPFTAVTT